MSQPQISLHIRLIFFFFKATTKGSNLFFPTTCKMKCFCSFSFWWEGKQIVVGNKYLVKETATETIPF